MKIVISSDTVEISTENQIIIKNMVNLSSLHNQSLIELLNSLMNINKKINILRITSPFMQVKRELKQSISSKKPIVVWYVVDEDDKYSNIKIKNINKMNNYMKVGIIEMKYEESKSEMVSITGKEQRMITAQVLDETSKLLGCHKRYSKNGISNVNIVKLKNKIISSIAGITVMLNRENIPFTITENSFQKFPSWTLLDNNQLIKMMPDDKRVVPQEIMKNISWAMTIEGTMYAIFDGKIQRFKVDENVNGNSGMSNSNGIELTLESIKNIFINIAKFINKWFQKIIKMVGYERKVNKTNKKNKTKETNVESD